MKILEALRQTSEAISEASDIKQAMRVMNERLCADLEADASSTFILDEEHSDYVLINTTRNQNILPGQWRIQSDKGLVSKVAQRGELINLDDCSLDEITLNCRLTQIKQYNFMVF